MSFRCAVNWILTTFKSDPKPTRACVQPPEYRIARGAGHFAYLAPCSLEFKKSEPKLCKDPAGFNRELWHQTMNAAVVSFFKRQLQPIPR